MTIPSHSITTNRIFLLKKATFDKDHNCLNYRQITNFSHTLTKKTLNDLSNLDDFLLIIFIILTILPPKYHSTETALACTRMTISLMPRAHINIMCVFSTSL